MSFQDGVKDYKYISALSNTPTAGHNAPVATGLRGVYMSGMRIDNSDNAAKTYIQIFDDIPANVTLGTTTPNDVVTILAGAIIDFEFTRKQAILFTHGFTIAATTGRANSTAPSSTVAVTTYFVEN